MKFKTVFLQLFLNLLAGVVITLLVRKYMFYQGIAVDLGAWSVFYTVFGVLYAIIIGLILIDSLAKFEHLKSTIDEEICTVQKIRDFLAYFDSSQKPVDNIILSLKKYTDSVCVQEWGEMNKMGGDVHIRSSQELKELIIHISKLKIEDENDNIALSAIMNSVSDLTTHRAKRIYLSSEEVSPFVMYLIKFMSVMIVLGFVILGVEDFYIHIYMIWAMSTTVQIVLNLLKDLSSPFEGIWAISNDYYIQLKEEL